VCLSVSLSFLSLSVVCYTNLHNVCFYFKNLTSCKAMFFFFSFFAALAVFEFGSDVSVVLFVLRLPESKF